MNPAEFRSRFVSNVQQDPVLRTHATLIDELSEFVSFDALVLNALHPDDAAFLVNAGLPRQAAPFLHFTAYSEPDLRDLYDLYDMPPDLFPFGGNGSGDPLGIELSTRAVVYFNHDNEMRRIFINSTVSQFAEALCMYQEAQAHGTFKSLLERLSVVDSACADPGSMWPMEIAFALEEHES
jgi:hypothetical protein